MRVTALKQVTPERIDVVLEDATEVRSTLGVTAELRLFAGKDLDEAQTDELKRLSRFALTRERALTLLASRSMSCKELRDKLLSKGEREDAIEGCVQWLCDHGLLDDRRYAGQLVRHYAAKNYGEARLRAELSRRGIERELWEEALSEAPEPDDKLDAFLASRLKDPSDPVQIRKLSAALARRGYSWEQIRDALRRCADSIYEDSV